MLANKKRKRDSLGDYCDLSQASAENSDQSDASEESDSELEVVQLADLRHCDRSYIGHSKSALIHFGKLLRKHYQHENWQSAEDVPEEKWEQSMIGCFPSYLKIAKVNHAGTIYKYLSELRSFVSTKFPKLENQLFEKRYYSQVRRKVKSICSENLGNIKRASYEDFRVSADSMFQLNTTQENILRALQNINLQLLGRLEDANNITWASLKPKISKQQGLQHITISFRR